MLFTVPLAHTHSSLHTIRIKRSSWLTRITPPVNFVIPLPSASIDSMSKWFVGSSSTRKLGLAEKRRQSLLFVWRVNIPSLLTHAHLRESNAWFLPSTETRYDLQRHFTANSKASELSSILFDRLAWEVSLKQFHARHVHLQLVNVMLWKVSKLESTVMMNDSTCWRHVAHDNLQQCCFTSAVLADNADSRLSIGSETNSTEDGAIGGRILERHLVECQHWWVQIIDFRELQHHFRFLFNGFEFRPEMKSENKCQEKQQIDRGWATYNFSSILILDWTLAARFALYLKRSMNSCTWALWAICASHSRRCDLRRSDLVLSKFS